jgi:hypothetical protein
MDGNRTASSHPGFHGYPACVIAGVVFCLPAILNPGRINSDSAVVALQANHYLQGDFDFFVWGTSYQGPVYPLFYALAFALGGASPITAIVAPMLVLCISVCLMHAILVRVVPGSLAMTLALFTLFSPQMENTFSFFPIRHVALCLLILSIYLLLTARLRSDARSGTRWLFAGSFVYGIALVADLMLLSTIPAIGVLIAFVMRPMKRRAAIRACIVGLGLPVMLFIVTRLTSDGAQSNLQIDLWRFTQNTRVLVEQALPYALGWQTVLSYDQPVNPVVELPGAIRVVQMIVGAAFLLMTLGGAVLFFRKALPEQVRMVGLVGTVGVVSTLAAFLVSGAPFDAFSARYLMPILVFAPLSLVPLANALSRRIALAILLPILLHFAIAGWLSYGDQVQRGLPARAHRWALDDEAALQKLLRERNIKHGLAGYWQAYRLTFLLDREVIIVPFQEFLDRSARYRDAVAGASRTCAIFHSNEGPNEPDSFERMLRDRGLLYERKTVGKYTVFLMPP